MAEAVKNISKEYPLLTLELKESNQAEYDLGIIIACKNELEKGFKFVDKHEATDNGTVLDFTNCENKKELVASNEILAGMINDFKKKYDGWDLSYILS